MTQQTLPTLVPGKADGAVRTTGHFAAIQTVHMRGIAAPIEQHNSLFPSLRDLAQRSETLRREQRIRSSKAAYVNQFYLRQFTAAHAPGKARHRQLALLRRIKSFQVRCGGAEDKQSFVLRRTKPGKFFSMIKKAFVLLERAVVFLIQHNQAEARQRQKK